MIEVQYDDATHTYYTIYRGERRIYTSATTLIGRYKEKFDAQRIAENYALKNGNTPEYWIKKWATISKEACDKGSTEHKHRENLDYKDKGINTSGKRLLNYHSLQDGIYPELKLWHHLWCIAGRADKVTIETVNNKRFMHIADYKTNKEISNVGFQFKNGKYKTMFKPLGHLHDCNLVHYTLQLSLYQYMAEYLGFYPGTRTLIHVPNGTVIKEYEVGYWKKDILNMLNDASLKGYIYGTGC